MEKQYAWRTDVLKIEKIIDESEAGFNFSRNISTQAHILCFIMLENMSNK